MKHFLQSAIRVCNECASACVVFIGSGCVLEAFVVITIVSLSNTNASGVDLVVRSSRRFVLEPVLVARDSFSFLGTGSAFLFNVLVFGLQKGRALCSLFRIR